MSILPALPSRNHRLLLDMHIPGWDERFLANYEPAKVAAAQTAAGAGSVMVYCQSHLGLCYWPTTVGQRHPAMGERDWLGESLAALHPSGAQVFGYYSVIFNNHAFEAHPDWRITPRPPAPAWVSQGERYGQVCLNNLDYRAFVEAELNELFSGYRFDGFFFDMTFWRGVCQCPACLQRVRREGLAMPARIDWADPVWCEFQAARERWLVEFAQFLNQLARRHGIPLVYHNSAVALFNWRFGAGVDMAAQSDFLGGDFYGDMDEQFLCSRYFLNLSSSQPIEFMTSRCAKLSDHVSNKPLAALQTQAFAALCSGAAFRLIDAIDPDGSICAAAYGPVAQVFARLEPYQAWFGGDPIEDVAVYLSDYSKMNLAENGLDYNDPMALKLPSPHLAAALGALRALRQQHIPVGVISRRQLGCLANYPVIVLAEVTRMSLAEVQAFRAYVQEGGHLYASGTSSCYTLQGPAPSFQLADCFGVEHVAAMQGKSIYAQPEDLDWCQRVLPQTYLSLADGAQQVRARHADVQVLGRLVLPYAYPHPGTVDDRHWASIHSSPPDQLSAHPALTRHCFGRGRVTYCAASLEGAAHAAAVASFQWIVADLLEGGPRFQADTFAQVWLTVFHQPAHQRYVLHLLNYPTELPAVPVRDLRVVIRRQPGQRLTQLRVQPTGQILALTPQGSNHWQATLPELADYAMLVVDYLAV